MKMSSHRGAERLRLHTGGEGRPWISVRGRPPGKEGLDGGRRVLYPFHDSIGPGLRHL